MHAGDSIPDGSAVAERARIEARSREVASVFGVVCRRTGGDGQQSLSTEASFCNLLRLNKLTVILSHSCLDWMTDEGRAFVRGWHKAYVLRTMRINEMSIAGTRHVHALLHEANVDHAIFKGPLQHLDLYGDAFARPSGDVDVLVSRWDFQRSAKLLRAAGFTSQDHHRTWWRVFLGEQHFDDPDGRRATVDLHHKLQQPGSPNGLPSANAIERSVMSSLGGASCPTLDRCDTAIICALSVAKAFVHREALGGYLMDYELAQTRLNETERTELSTRVAAGRLNGTFAVVDRLRDAAFGRRVDDREVLHNVDSEQLALMAFAPQSPQIVWPRRRRVLRELCNGDIGLFGQELMLAIASEGVRMATGQRAIVRKEPA